MDSLTAWIRNIILDTPKDGLSKMINAAKLISSTNPNLYKVTRLHQALKIHEKRHLRGYPYPDSPNKKPIVIYSVLTGAYEPLKELKTKDPNCRYILFTDNQDLVHDDWEVYVLDNPAGISPRRLSRKPKINPFRYLPRHDYSLYLDASLFPTAPGISNYIIEQLKYAEMALYPHYQRDCVFSEIDFLLKGESRILSEPSNGLKARHLYESIGHEPNSGLFENAIILRKDTKTTRAVCEFWENLYYSGAERDQFTLAYCINTFNPKVKRIEDANNFRKSPLFSFIAHKYNVETSKKKEAHATVKKDNYSRLYSIAIRKVFTVISFDIFDTLITRATLLPKDVFVLTSEWASKEYPDFTKYDHVTLREKSEKMARIAKNGEDPTYDEIYIIYRINSGLSVNEVNKIMDLEIQVELTLVQANSKILDLLIRLKESGKRIILISDMYHSQKTIIKILKKAGINLDYFDKIYISSELGVSKKSGKIYQYINSDLQVNSDSCLHIGDKSQGDIKNAERSGWTAFKIKSNVDYFAESHKTSLINCFAGQDYASFDNYPIAQRYSLGLVANRLAKSVSNDGQLEISTLYDFGYSILGPFTSSLCLWAINKMRKENSKTIFWLARDGHLPYQAFNQIISLTPIANDIRSEYLPISRRMLIPHLFQSHEGLNYLLSIKAGKDFTASDFLIFRLGEECAHMLANNIGLSLVDLSRIDYNSIKNRIDSMISNNFKLIRAFHLSEALRIEKFYSSKLDRVDNSEKAFVFDVGRKGTFQRILSKITGKQMFGLYVVTSSQIRHNLRPGSFDTFLGNYCASLSGKKKVDTVIYESLLSDPRPTYTGVNSSGQPYRLLSAPTGDFIYKHSEIQAGALDYVKDLCRIHGNHVMNAMLESHDANYGISNWHLNSSTEKLLSSIPHEDSVSTSDSRALGTVYNTDKPANSTGIFQKNCNTIFVFSPRMNTVRGGAERVSSILCNYMQSLGYCVISLTSKSAQLNVPVYYLDLAIPSIEVDLKSRDDIQEIFDKYSPSLGIILASGSSPSLLLEVARRYGIKIINSERAEPCYSLSHYWKDFSLQDYLNYYSSANTIVLQFDSFRSHFPDYLQKNIQVIGNPVNLPSLVSDYTKRRNRILCVARIWFTQKRQDILYKAFCSIANQYQDWTLSFVGYEYEDHGKLLRNLIDRDGLQHRVEFLGHLDKVDSIYNDSSLFVLPSLFEGFPNALSEALSYGIPSLGFESCGGVNNLIKNQVNGVLVRDNNGNAEKNVLIESLADNLSCMIDNYSLRVAMSKNAMRDIKQYDADVVLKQWANLIDRSTRD